ncbi:MAG: flagellar hook-basal body protein [Solirubrobacterales bacterium]
MNRGLYTAGAGMMLQLARQDVLSNNLANLSTAGYKKDTAVCKEFPTMLLQRIFEISEENGVRKPIPPIEVGRIGTGATLDRTYTNYDAGSFRPSENNNDFALRDHDTFFAVETPQGVRYTRNGQFQINNEGVLVTAQNDPVLGQKGQIVPGKDFVVNEKGEFTLADGTTDSLQIYRFEDLDSLKKIGASFYDPGDMSPVAAPDAGVLQGYYEVSNVNPVQEMVDLITVVRAYELSQKAVQSEDEMTGQAVSQVGSLR